MITQSPRKLLSHVIKYLYCDLFVNEYPILDVNKEFNFHIKYYIFIQNIIPQQYLKCIEHIFSRDNATNCHFYSIIEVYNNKIYRVYTKVMSNISTISKKIFNNQFIHELVTHIICCFYVCNKITGYKFLILIDILYKTLDLRIPVLREITLKTFFIWIYLLNSLNVRTVGIFMPMPVISTSIYSEYLKQFKQSKLTEFSNSSMDNTFFKNLVAYLYTCILVSSDISLTNFLSDYCKGNLLYVQNVTLLGILIQMPITFLTNNAEGKPFHMPTIYYLKINAEDLMPFYIPKFKHVFSIFLYYLNTCYICLKFIIKLKICGPLHLKMKLNFPNYTTFCLQFFRLWSISQSGMPCQNKPSFHFSDAMLKYALEFLAIFLNIIFLVTDACVKTATRFCPYSIGCFKFI